VSPGNQKTTPNPPRKYIPRSKRLTIFFFIIWRREITNTPIVSIFQKKSKTIAKKRKKI
jgi:hypothetical protein